MHLSLRWFGGRLGGLAVLRQAWDDFGLDRVVAGISTPRHASLGTGLNVASALSRKGRKSMLFGHRRGKSG